MCRRLQAKVDLDAKAFQREIDQVRDRIVANLGAALFVMLPSFALWLRLAYANRRLRYTEHLVFALHLHAFWFIAIAFTLVPQAWIALPALMAVPVYGWFAIGRVYADRWPARLLRTGLISVLHSLVLVLAMTALAAWSLLA